MPRQTSLKRKPPSPDRAYPPITVVRLGQPAPPPAVRGVRLKVVSTFTMVFAVVCLIAFLAGRTEMPAEAATDANQEPIMFHGLRTARYDAKDLAAAKDWYSKVLGIRPYFDQPFYVGFEIGGYELGIVPAEHAHAKRPPAGVAYWGVDDAPAAYQHLLDLGAAPLEPVEDVGDGILIGAVHDPFGNVFGVIQNPHFKTK
jgi:predicted enzyme related to lactoylglutathione lyase